MGLRSGHTLTVLRRLMAAAHLLEGSPKMLEPGAGDRQASPASDGGSCDP